MTQSLRISASIVLGFCSFLMAGRAQDSRPTRDGTKTYTGRVLNAADGKPLAGATVALIPNSAVVGTHAEHSVQITEANGTYKFQDVPWPSAFVLATHEGFDGARSNGSQNTQAPVVALEDVALSAVALPVQMNGAGIVEAYPTSSTWVHYRDASFSTDGETLNFTSEDGGRGGGTHGWSYDLRSHTLHAGAVQPVQPDLEVVGNYHINSFMPCHGCAATVTATPLHDPTRAKPVVVTSTLDSGIVASSDKAALVWGVNGNAQIPNARGRYQHLIGMYVLATHKRGVVVLPIAGAPIAARPDGDGFLVAYQSFGQCVLSTQEMIRLAEDQAYREGPRAWSICFVHVPSPGK